MVRDPTMIVVAGCPRSGSHLLIRELERQTEIAVPTETRSITLFSRSLWVVGSLRTVRSRERLVRCIYSFLYLWEKRNRTAPQLRATLPYSLLSTIGEAQSIFEPADDFGDIIRAMYGAYGRRFGCSTIVEKLSFYEYESVDLLARHLPEVKVAHIVRDGRDVCLSWRKVWFGPRSVTESAYRWRQHVEGLRDWGRRNPERYLEIKYEDLLENGEAVLRTLASFFGVRLGGSESTEGKQRKMNVLAEREGHERLVEPIDGGNRGKWRTGLSESEIREFNTAAGKTLAEFGYEVCGGTEGRLLRSWFRLRAWCLYAMRPLTWRRWCLLVLPVALVGSDRCGVGISRRLFREVRTLARSVDV